jgi:hypothetical protein
MKLRIIEEIRERKRFDINYNVFYIQIRGYFKWSDIETSDGINSKRLDFKSYEEAEKQIYEVDFRGSGVSTKNGNIYKFKQYSYYV